MTLYDGQSVVPTIVNPEHTTKDAIFHVFPRNRRGVGEVLGRALRTERYRLVEWKKTGAASETADLEPYDYQADPAETRNVAKDQPEIAAQLRAILNRQP